MKKILSAALAALLAVSALTTTAFAENLTGTDSVSATGTAGIPPLKITMPKSMAFIFNPYKLKMTDKGKVDAENGVEKVIVGSFTDTDKTAWQITNNSGGAVKCAFYVVAEKGEGANEALTLRDDSDTAAAGTGKKDVKIKISASTEGGTAVVPKVQTSALASTLTWFESSDSSSGAIARIPSIADTKTLDIVPTATVTNNTNSAWDAKDVFNLNFVFQFEFATA